MILNRRSFVGISAAAVTARAGSATPTRQSFDWSRIKALAFDAFPVFDPRPVFRACEEVFPGRGSGLAEAWRARQFEYQWLRALAGKYADFWQITRSALEFAAQSLRLELSRSKRDVLMQGYLELKAWPDVPGALAALRSSGRQLAFVSNATAPILNAGIRNSGLEGIFHHVISTDRIRTFKPDPRAYQLGLDVLGLRAQEVLFVAFAGWDVAGAGWFGHPTFWNNRLNATAEQLDVAPDGMGATLTELPCLLGGKQPSANCGLW